MCSLARLKQQPLCFLSSTSTPSPLSRALDTHLPLSHLLCRLALGMSLQRRQACTSRVGYYHAELLLHGDQAKSFLGGAAHPSLAPPPAAALAGCCMRTFGYNHALAVEAAKLPGGSGGSRSGPGSGGGAAAGGAAAGGAAAAGASAGAGAAAGPRFDPGSWPWQNCTAWSLTDQLSGPVLGALADGGGGGGGGGGEVQLPLLPGVNCSFGIATTAGGGEHWEEL